VLVVLDTNVLVAAMRSKHGASSAVLQRLALGQFRPAVSTALCLEYDDVLHRPGMVPAYTPQQITDFIDSILTDAQEAYIYFNWRPFLRDPDDDLVFECALAAGATHIVTFNRVDFAGVSAFGIAVVTPGDFLRILSAL
jgi:putative PIN family toxin of toxin-antitoxin system